MLFLRTRKWWCSLVFVVDRRRGYFNFGRVVLLLLSVLSRIRQGKEKTWQKKLPLISSLRGSSIWVEKIDNIAQRGKKLGSLFGLSSQPDSVSHSLTTTYKRQFSARRLILSSCHCCVRSEKEAEQKTRLLFPFSVLPGATIKISSLPPPPPTELELTAADRRGGGWQTTGESVLFFEDRGSEAFVKAKEERIYARKFHSGLQDVHVHSI